MSGSPQALSVMVLTEDSGSDAYDTVRALVKEMFKLLAPDVREHCIEFKPLDDDRARCAMQGNIWKSEKPLTRPARVLLIRSIITELLKPEGFVLYHIDGDVPWSQRGSSENVRMFLERMRSPVEEGVRSRLPGEVEKRMKRLHLIVPFYSIEAWLFQNTQEARLLCSRRNCGQCHSQLVGWEKSRSSLDEVVQPKTETLCFKAKYNARLAAAGFPAGEVFDAQASFARTVEELLDCDELTAALERIREDSSSPSLVTEGSGEP